MSAAMFEDSHSAWGAQALQQQLQPLLPGLSVQVLPRVASTNTQLLALATNGQPRLLVAEQQTHGRGRLGRHWHASAGASLTFSLALPLAPRAWSGLSLAVGLALAEALDPLSDSAACPRLGLKWPNDLWLWLGPGQGRKLGGILIETVAGAGSRVCVVGVGLNIAPQPNSGPSAGAACLQELDAGATAARALATVAGPLAQALRRFERDGFAPLAAAYARRDLLQGQPVSTHPAVGHSSAPALQGWAEGVDEDGALCIRSNGALQRLVSGEVSVRLGPLAKLPPLAMPPGAGAASC